MQRKSLGKAMHYLVAVCALVSALAMFACGGDDDEDEVRNVVATVPVGDDTVAAVQGRTFTIANGQVFGGNVGNHPVILTFTTPRTFTMTRAATGLSLSGTVSYGSECLLYFDRHGRRTGCPLRLNL